MKRRVFNILSALSVVLCVVTCVAWLLSRNGPIGISCVNRKDAHLQCWRYVYVGQGTIVFGNESFSYPNSVPTILGIQRISKFWDVCFRAALQQDMAAPPANWESVFVVNGRTASFR